MNRIARMSLLTVVLVGVIGVGAASAWDPSCYLNNGQPGCYSIGPWPSWLPENRTRYAPDTTTTSSMAACLGPFVNAPWCTGSKTTGPASCHAPKIWSNTNQKCEFAGAAVVGGGVLPPSEGGDDNVSTGTVPKVKPEEPEKHYSEAGDCWADTEGAAAAGTVAAAAAVTGATKLWTPGMGVQTFDQWFASLAAQDAADIASRQVAAQQQALGRQALAQAVRNQSMETILATRNSTAVRYVYSSWASRLTESQALGMAMKAGRPQDYIAAKSMGIKFLGGLAVAGTVASVATFVLTPASANAGPGFYAGRGCE